MIRLIRAELLKLRTTRLWWGLLIGVVAGSALLAGVDAGLAGRGNAGMPGVGDAAMVRTIYTAGISVAYLITLSLGIIMMAGEYRQATMTATVLCSPRRERIVVAKLVALLVAGVGYGMAAAITAVAVGAPIILARGGSARLLSDGVPRTLGLAVLAVALWGVLGLGVGTLIRNQVVALLVTIGTAWLVEPLASVALNALDAGAVARFLPSSATSSLISPPTGAGGFTQELLPWWGGALVLLGYAAVSGALGAAITLRRDIS
ncbi:MAG TPA: ABC transporter permease [Kineosporiaceae bacterium]|nr:ABC transporter permease [Kineosporiaceae bacterium]